MWYSFAKRSTILSCNKLAGFSVRRSLSSSTRSSPLGEGEVEFRAITYPSFWSRLKQQRQGLGFMALSASCAFLAMSLIKQEKDLTRLNESVDRLKQDNESLRRTVENVKSVLKGEGDVRTDLVALLQDVVYQNGQAPVEQLPIDSSGEDESENVGQSPTRPKFMV